MEGGMAQRAPKGSMKQVSRPMISKQQPSTSPQKWSSFWGFASGYASGLCFGVCFGGMLRKSATFHQYISRTTGKNTNPYIHMNTYDHICMQLSKTYMQLACCTCFLHVNIKMQPAWNSVTPVHSLVLRLPDHHCTLEVPYCCWKFYSIKRVPIAASIHLQKK